MFKQHVITVYGETTYHDTRKLQTLRRQAASSKCKWIFLCRCLKNELLPKSFTTRPVIRTQRAYRETREYNRRMLQITHDNEKTQYHRYLREIQRIVLTNWKKKYPVQISKQFRTLQRSRERTHFRKKRND